MVFSCPQCHFINHSGDHYCGGCGSSFAVRPTPREFLQEEPPNKGEEASPEARKSGFNSSKAIQDFLLSQKGPKSKKKSAKDEKKQVSQDEIERLIHESAEAERQN